MTTALRLVNTAFALLPLIGLGLLLGELITGSPRVIELAMFTIASTAVAAYYEWSGSH